MKYFSILLLAITFSICANAKTWRVNNNPGVVADFTTFSDAVAAASAGDTIHVEPSPINYSTGSFSLENA